MFMFVAISQLFDAATTAWLFDCAAFTPSPLRTSFSLFSHLFRVFFSFLGGVSHKGQPVVGDGDAVTGDKTARIVSGLSLLPATKEKISAGDKCQLDCAA